jgi:hypothetical protein
VLAVRPATSPSRIVTTAPEIPPVIAIIPLRYTAPSISDVGNGGVFGNNEMDRGNGKGAGEPGCGLGIQAALTIVSPIPVACTLPGPMRITTPDYLMSRSPTR